MIQLVVQLVNQIRIGHFSDLSTTIVNLKSSQNVGRIIYKIQNPRLGFSSCNSIQSTQRLDCGHSIQSLVNVHCTKHRLVKASLKFVRHNQNLEFIGAKCFPDVPLPQTWIENGAGLGILRALIVNLATESDQSI